MKRTCTKPNCARPTVAKGLCASHYQMARLDRMREEERRGAKRQCQVCGASIPLTKDMRTLFCSVVCKERARQTRDRVAAGRAYETCRQCGTSLSLIGKNRDAQFCSEKCMVAARVARLRTAALARKKPCVHCGGPLPLQRQRFCSDDCYVAHRRPEKYGLTQVELDVLLAQNSVCAICHTDNWTKKGPQVDHDHLTGAVRGVLCARCNAALGLLGDDPARLRSAIAYLERDRP